MDQVEMAIITEIANEEIRNILLNEHRKDIPKMLNALVLRSEPFPIFECTCPTCKTAWKAIGYIDKKRCQNCGQLLMW